MPATPRSFDSPRLLPLLPLLYVAWSDGDLSSTEINEIRKLTTVQSFLDDAAREQLDGWLDPSAPPSASELRKLLRRIHVVASDLDTPSRQTLAELGVALARADLEGSGADWLDTRTLDAVGAVEASLGIVGFEATRAMLPNPPGAIPAPAESMPAFDVDAMRALLDGRLVETRDRVRALLRDPAFEYTYDWSKDEHREQVLRWLQRIADEGIPRLGYPGVFDDAKDLGPFIAVFETLAFFDLSLVIKFGVQFGLFGGSIYFLGTEQHHQRLGDVASGRLLGCFAMTEFGHGSNVRDLETTATFDTDTDTFIVHSPTESAGKNYIGNAATHGQLATVFAQLVVGEESHGVHALLVPIRDADGAPAPGVRIEDCGHKIGLNGVDNGQLWFDQVRVPRASLLDRFGQVSADGQYTSPIASESRRFFTMLSTLVGGRVSVASAGLSAAKSALAIAVHHSARRRQFGAEGRHEQPILDYQTHQRRLMPLLARTYALNFALHDLTDRFALADPEDEDARREVEAQAAGLKALATWHTTETIQTSRECCGGSGYMSVNRFGSLKADTDVFTTFEGDNTVLMQLVAKSLLSDFRKQFSDDRYFSMLRFVTRRATTSILERNPITTRRTDPDHLQDPEFLGAALRYREDTLLTQVARRLQKRIASGLDAFNAFLLCQNHLVDAAHAHVERLVFDSFNAAVARNIDERAATVLANMRSLYALDCVRRDLGWYMEEDYIESSKARAIRKLITKLCLDLRDQARHLVDAFGIPSRALAAPIAAFT